MRKYVTLSRQIEVTEIPAGTKGVIEQGTPLTIVQALGGSYTAMTMQGWMVRIEGADADAIGEEAPSQAPAPELQGQKSLRDLAWAQDVL